MNFSVSATLLYGIVGAVILTYFPYLFVASGRFQVGYDTSAPRAMFDKLPAYAQRATWAHQNCFEALIIFSAAALMAYVTGVESDWAKISAIAFLVSRLFFSLFYILDLPPLRSLMFVIGSASSFTLFALSLKMIS
jgi:uncharacterized MAPEG superfamily protein